MTGITVSLHEDHQKFFHLSRSVLRYAYVDCLVLSGHSYMKPEGGNNWFSEQTDRSKRCQKPEDLFWICCTIFALLLRPNKAHHNFSTVRYVCGYWNLLCRLDVKHFVHICMLLQSIPQYVNLYLNITVPLKLRNGTTSHVVFCYAKKIR